MIHLTIHQLSSHLDRELPESSTELVRRHLQSCDECSERFAALREQEEALDRLLVHEPPEEFFAQFADAVLGVEPDYDEAEDWGTDRRRVDRRVTERRVTERRVTDRRAASRRVEEKTVPPKPPAPKAAAAPPVAQPPVAPEPPPAQPTVATGPPPAQPPVAPEPPVAFEPFARPAVPFEPTPARPPRTRKPTVDPPRVASRRRERRSQPAIPWFVAVILCAIVAAVAYVMPRPHERAPVALPQPALANDPAREAAPLPAPAAPEPPPPAARVAPERADRALDASPVEPRPSAEEPRARPGTLDAGNVSGEERPVAPPAERHVAPVRRIITTSEVSVARPRPDVTPRTDPAPRLPKPEPPDEFASAPAAARPMLAAARSAARAASLDSSAANLDAAAESWEQTVAVLDGPLGTAARHHLAEARYRAWTAAPDPYRAADATAALRAYLVFAPAGPARDSAKAWLSRVSGGR